MAKPWVRDIFISVFLVGMIAFGMFTLTSGMISVYDTPETDDRVENALQDNQDLMDTVTGMQEDLSDEDVGFLESAYIVLFKGFKVFVLSLVSVFSSSTAMIATVGEYFGLGTFATYISLIVIITIIATIWYALQGREGV